LHVAEAFGGGLMAIVNMIAEGGARSGASHTIAYGRRPETPLDPRAGVAAGVELIELDWRRRAPRSHVAVVSALRRICDEFSPDVIHLHSSFAGAVGVLALRGRAPLLYTPHSFASAIADTPRLLRTAFRASERYIVRSADVVGAVSDSEARTAEMLGARRLVCVQNGIPELDPTQLDSAPEHIPKPVRPRVIAAGRVIAQRQPEACARILSAVADVADIGWIGGGADDGPARRAANDALTAAGAPPTGWLPREAMMAALRAATAYLHWTAWDGQALSLLEAMACDAVIVASDIPPSRDVLDPRQICATEAEAIQLLRRIATDESFASELLAVQRRRRARHSAAAMVRRWLAVYEELAARSAPGSVTQPARVS
jgi:glycosyltransferase involved in cell wall biosynthesis